MGWLHQLWFGNHGRDVHVLLQQRARGPSDGDQPLGLHDWLYGWRYDGGNGGPLNSERKHGAEASRLVRFSGTYCPLPMPYGGYGRTAFETGRYGHRNHRWFHV